MKAHSKIQTLLFVAFLGTWLLPLFGIDSFLSDSQNEVIESMQDVADEYREVVTFPRLILLILHYGFFIGGAVLFLFSASTWAYLSMLSVLFHAMFLVTGSIFALSAQALVVTAVSYFVAGALAMSVEWSQPDQRRSVLE